MMLSLMLPMIISLIFINLNHPMLMVATIIVQTLLLCMTTWMVTNTAWFSFILFLVFLGGLMVLFVYICSLASNEEMKIKLEPIKLILISMIVMFSMFEMNKIQQMTTTNSIFKMMANMTMTPTIISMFYLLLTLIVVVKITDNKMSALRTMKS